MQVHLLPDAKACGQAAAEVAIAALRDALETRGEARLVLATGASQFHFLETLTQANLDWVLITAFHLDEYVGLPEDHPASFRSYLRQRFMEPLSEPVHAIHFIRGDAPNPSFECVRLGSLLSSGPIDLVCCGIGENGHLAFNDPPADFHNDAAYHVVELDEACRRQQVGEGWFSSLEEVPTRAISMTIRRLLRGKTIVCTVPEARKAAAVKATVEGPITPAVPASILKNHPGCHLFLDPDSASLLEPTPPAPPPDAPTPSV